MDWKKEIIESIKEEEDHGDDYPLFKRLSANLRSDWEIALEACKRQHSCLGYVCGEALKKPTLFLELVNHEEKIFDRDGWHCAMDVEDIISHASKDIQEWIKHGVNSGSHKEQYQQARKVLECALELQEKGIEVEGDVFVIKEKVDLAEKLSQTSSRQEQRTESKRMKI